MRYRERARDRRSTDGSVIAKLRTIVEDGDEYQPKPKFAVKLLLKHGIKPTRYFKLYGLMVWSPMAQS